jgi:hypothetical protein
MTLAQFGDSAVIDVKSNHADTRAGERHSHGQPDVTESDDRNFSSVSQPQDPSPKMRETITGMYPSPQ